jgi:hypothetical protein
MGRMISIHEYELKVEVAPEVFEHTFKRAAQEGLFELPGLVDHVLLKGIKGSRRNQYTALWMYEDRVAWERLWGPPEDPHGPDSYPERWQTWEREFLKPLLSTDPDRITFTAYEEIRNDSPPAAAQ